MRNHRSLIVFYIIFLAIAMSAGGCGNREDAAWQKAAKANNKEQFQAYLAEHPNGAHAFDAKSALDLIEAGAIRAKEEAARKEKKEAEARAREQWDKVVAENKVETYLAFIKENPQSPYAENARFTLRWIKWDKANKAGTFKALAEFAVEYPNSSDVEQRWWQLVYHTGTVENCQEFLKHFPKSQFLPQAHRFMESKSPEWIAAEKLKTHQAYEAFLKKYPDGVLAGEAKKKMVEIDWTAAAQVNTLEAYEAFLQKHPKSDRSASAEVKMSEIEWTRAANQNTLEAYEAFVKKYPGSLKFFTARERMADFEWKTTVAANDIEEIIRFLKKYPAGSTTKSAEAVQRLGALKWEKARRLDMIEAYTEYLNENYPKPTVPNLSEREIEAAARIKSLYWDKATKIGTYESHAEFIKRYPADENSWLTICFLLADARQRGKLDAFYAAFQDQAQLTNRLKTYEKDVVFAEKFAPALKGAPVPGTRAFNGKADKGIIVLTDTGFMHPYHRQMRGRADDLASAEVVLILGEQRKVFVESKEYRDAKGNLTSISRFRYGLNARLVEASTGKLLAEKYIVNEPRALKFSEPWYIQSVGFTVGPEQLSAWMADPNKK